MKPSEKLEQLLSSTYPSLSKDERDIISNALKNIKDSIQEYGTPLENALTLEFYTLGDDLAQIIRENLDEKTNTALSDFIKLTVKVANIKYDQKIVKQVVNGSNNDTALLKILITNKFKEEEKQREREFKRSKNSSSSELKTSLEELYEIVQESEKPFNQRGNPQQYKDTHQQLQAMDQGEYELTFGSQVPTNPSNPTDNPKSPTFLPGQDKEYNRIKLIEKENS